jgi:hypothetical protein
METLLDRGADGDLKSDLAEAEAAFERLAAAPAEEGLVTRKIWMLRLRARLARARGDETGYREYRDRYREMAEAIGFEGHLDWAKAMSKHTLVTRLCRDVDLCIVRIPINPGASRCYSLPQRIT